MLAFANVCTGLPNSSGRGMLLYGVLTVQKLWLAYCNGYHVTHPQTVYIFVFPSQTACCWGWYNYISPLCGLIKFRAYIILKFHKGKFDLQSLITRILFTGMRSTCDCRQYDHREIRSRVTREWPTVYVPDNWHMLSVSVNKLHQGVIDMTHNCVCAGVKHSRLLVPLTNKFRLREGKNSTADLLL